MSIQVAEMK